MKRRLCINVGLTVLLWFSCNMLYAQNNSLKKELLVYILPDSLELPAHEKGEVSLQKASVKSNTLATALTKAKVTGISKAFPAWTNKDSVAIRNDGEPVQLPPFHRIFSLKFNTEEEADSAITILKQSSAVLFAEKNSELTLDNDPYYVNGTQWYLNNDGSNGGVIGADINAEGAWAIYTGNSTNKIAILDTGVESSHEDLEGKVTADPY